MSRTLLQRDVVGRRLKRILSSYELLDGWLDHAPVWFELDSLVAFQLPFFADETLEEAVVPPDAEALDDSAVEAVLGARVERVLRSSCGPSARMGMVCLYVEGGSYLRVQEHYPHGVGYVGLHITREVPWPGDAVDFWSE